MARFPRRCRLTGGDEIRRVRAEGTRARNLWFEIRSVPSKLTYPRVAIVVPRYDETAVARNRVKRRLRAVVQRELLATLPPRDVVVRALPRAYEASYGALRAGMLRLVPLVASP